jgi:hypothetical protein
MNISALDDSHPIGSDLLKSFFGAVENNPKILKNSNIGDLPTNLTTRNHLAK